MKKFLILLVVVAIAIIIYLKVKPQKTELVPENTATTSQTNVPPEPQITTDGVNLFKEGKYEEAIRQLEKELKEKTTNERSSILNYLSQAYAKMAESGDTYFQSTTLSEVEKQAKARHCFTIALKGDLPKEKRDAIKQKLNLINRNLVFSPTINPSDSIIYKIKPGENIWKISDTFKVPTGSDTEGQAYLGQIRRINHMKTSNIRAGDTFKIITGKFSIEVNKSNFTLTLYLNNEFVKEYPIAVGEPKESPTPVGTFHILGASKIVNPPWYRYDKTTGKTTVIPFGDPAHSIGTRWMGFKDNEKVGIHGTNDPSSIGKAVTNGCIRMHNEDVEELFDLVPGGTEVIIRE